MGDFHSPFFHLDEGETFRAEALGVFGHCLDLALRRAGHAFCIQRLHDAAVGDGAAENFERARAKIFRHVHEFHAKRVSGLSMP